MKKQQLTIIITSVITTIVVVVGFILLMPIIGPRYMHPMMMGEQSVPNSLDTSTSRLSDEGLFQVSWSS
ncbi:hypothetical protein JZU68_09725, partial [bacterium]|nr:hypothetical protein [bacterium]